MRLVAGREVTERFRSKAYWATMAIMLAGALGLVVLPLVFDSEPHYEVGVAGDAPPGVEADLAALATAFQIELDVVPFGDAEGAQRAVTDEGLDAALVFADGQAALVRRSDTSQVVAAVANQAAVSATARQRLVDAGLAPAQAAEALATPPPTDVTVDDERPDRSTVAFLTSMVLYVALFIGGMGVATGVAAEKASRIAEVLVVTVRPSSLMAGKVIGIGISTLLLVLAAVVPFSVGIAVGVVDLPAVTAWDVAATIPWFLLGYLLYATAFAAMGALVDRQEDLASSVSPISAALVLSYFAAVQAQAAPNSTLAVATSLFPFSAPLAMPIRMANDAAPLWQVAASVALCLATLGLLVRVGGTIYERALLRGGRKLALREVLRG